ncbi:sialate O-acetylesterase [Chitinophaga sp. 212800010-3]|uniref:sialate O-acetylesterase n=1 Tax=unclassified Chitinophaga TaxID=2619133 RepID=UPI002E109FAD
MAGINTLVRKTGLLMAVACYSYTAHAEVKLPQLFSDNMVLQRNAPIPIWGWAAAGEKVTVRFNKQVKTIRAGKDGRWQLQLNAEAAGGPYELDVKGDNDLLIRNVLVGEVWICSGQSNMEFALKNVQNNAEEIKAANYPQIRELTVPRNTSLTPQPDILPASWKVCTPETAGTFSAVAYFFARKLQEELHVPIGLIHSSWGGTNVETWTSTAALSTDPDFKELPAITADKIKAGLPSNSPNSFPSQLFNAMLSPLIPYGIRGAIWYQGEANADRAFQYRRTFPLMINDWREHWHEGDFPFYFVQISSFNPSGRMLLTGSRWAELREAQLLTLSLPNTGMAVTTDIGNPTDVHPANKQDVGLRLALNALQKTYGRNVVPCGPIYQSIYIKNSTAILHFSNTGSGLVAQNRYGYLQGFQIAGADQQFKWAKADLQGDSVIVYNETVTAPVAVRYGWTDDAMEANLYNKEGLPATPFRTDHWDGLTTDKKYNIAR